jgi:hypothetical protein
MESQTERPEQTYLNAYVKKRAIDFGIWTVEKSREEKLAKERAIGRVTYVNMYIAPTNGENERRGRKLVIPYQLLNTRVNLGVA